MEKAQKVVARSSRRREEKRRDTDKPLEGLWKYSAVL